MKSSHLDSVSILSLVMWFSSYSAGVLWETSRNVLHRPLSYLIIMTPEIFSVLSGIFIILWLTRKEESDNSFLEDKQYLIQLNPGSSSLGWGAMGTLLLALLMRFRLSFQRWSIFVIMSIILQKNPIRGDCLNRGSWLSSQIYYKTTLGVVENEFHC